MECVELIFDSEHSGDDSDFELDENVLKELCKADHENNKNTVAIKKDLWSKIQQRRISEGQEELKVEFEPPRSYELSKEEKDKIERRKRRNRQSANKSRIRRQQKLETLLADEKTMLDKNQSLRAEVNALEKFKSKLETALNVHLNTCDKVCPTRDVHSLTAINETPTSSTVVEVCTATSASSLNTSKQDNQTLTTINKASNTVVEVHVATTAPRVITPRESNDVGLCANKCDNRPCAESVCNEYSPFSMTSADQTHPKSSGEKTINAGRGLGTVDRNHLRSLSKEQKIAMLKAYLKGNQSRPEVQTMIGNICELSRKRQQTL